MPFLCQQTQLFADLVEIHAVSRLLTAAAVRYAALPLLIEAAVESEVGRQEWVA